MYVTRPLSMYKRSPESLSAPTPEGPNSGYLVLHDGGSEEITCFGGSEYTRVKDLPFPQNKDLRVEYSSDEDDVAFIPVLDKPLSANTYHVIRRHGIHYGEVCTNSKEGGLKLKHQMKQCMFYEMRLEQSWEKFFEKYNPETISKANAVFVDTLVQREAVFLAGSQAFPNNLGRVNIAVDGFMWFKSSDGVGGERSVGLSMKIVERMKWEQERVGWVAGEPRKVQVKRIEEFGGTGGWTKFACYVLVERFALKRRGESLPLLTYDFKHTHQIRSKWE